MIEYMFYSTIALSYIELDKDTLTEPDDVYVTLDSSIDIEKARFGIKEKRFDHKMARSSFMCMKKMSLYFAIF